MQFTSFRFAVFFPIVVLLYYIMPKKLRQLWLLLASYYFYMGWNAKYAILIFISTVVTYFCGIFIDKKDIGDKRAFNDVMGIFYENGHSRQGGCHC